MNPMRLQRLPFEIAEVIGVSPKGDNHVGEYPLALLARTNTAGK